MCQRRRPIGGINVRLSAPDFTKSRRCSSIIIESGSYPHQSTPAVGLGGRTERRSRAGFLEKCWTAFATDLDPHDLEASGGMYVKCAVGFFVDILRKL